MYKHIYIYIYIYTKGLFYTTTCLWCWLKLMNTTNIEQNVNRKMWCFCHQTPQKLTPHKQRESTIIFVELVLKLFIEGTKY